MALIYDFYTVDPADPNYKFGILQFSDPIMSIITKIKMILNTKQGEVFGDVNFGVGLEDLVFETKINNLQLEEKIKTQIGIYVIESRDYKIEPVVSFGHAVGYDVCVVDIYVNSNKIIGILVK
jgi:phage baseplate assembly protein W